MKESAQIALSYVRAQLGITDPSILARHIHIHVPAGASQGRPVGWRHHGDRADLDGTGQAGTVRCRHDRRSHPERAGAADRRGEAEAAGGSAGWLDDCLRTEAKRADLDDVPADVLETITIVPTTDVSELVALAIEPISSADDTRVAA